MTIEEFGEYANDIGYNFYFVYGLYPDNVLGEIENCGAPVKQLYDFYVKNRDRIEGILQNDRNNGAGAGDK